MLAGTNLIVANDTFVKLVGTHVPTGQIMAYRGCIATALLLAACWYMGALRAPVAAFARPAIWVRLAGEIGATVAYLIALMHMTLADINGIQQFQPLMATAASALVLGERVGWRRWLAAAVGLLGVLLIVRPGSGAFQPMAILAMLCVVLVTLRDLATKRVPVGVSALLLSLMSAAGVTVFGFAMGLGETWVVPTTHDWLGMGAAAVLLIAGYFTITMAVRIGDLSVVSPFRYSGVLFSVLIQIAVWGTSPDAISLLGIAVVVAAGLYTFHREQMRR